MRGVPTRPLGTLARVVSDGARRRDLACLGSGGGSRGALGLLPDGTGPTTEPGKSKPKDRYTGAGCGRQRAMALDLTLRPSEETVAPVVRFGGCGSDVDGPRARIVTSGTRVRRLKPEVLWDILVSCERPVTVKVYPTGREEGHIPSGSYLSSLSREGQLGGRAQGHP